MNEMNQATIYQQIANNKRMGQKMFALLIDPDKVGSENELIALLLASENCGVDFIFVGGSLVTSADYHSIIQCIKRNTTIPLILFPNHSMFIDAEADAILFLSLISGRNPELLIGQQVMAAPILKKSKLEAISTGYMLIGTGSDTTAAYISQTKPIPAHKPEIAACTAMAGELLGMKAIYMDAGSGADKPIPAKLIAAVRRSVSVPLIIGGGLRTEIDIEHALMAGADIVVVGNAIEENPSLLKKLKSHSVKF